MNIKPILEWNIIGKSKKLLTVSLITILLSITIIGIRGFNLGVDFSGGLLMKAYFEEELEITSLRDSLAGIGFEGAMIQIDQRDPTHVMIRISEDVKPELLLETLETDIGAIDRESLSIERIGPVIGAELRRNALLTIVFALIIILLYTAIRFKPKHGIAAVYALIHDISLSLGIVSLFQIQLNTPTVAALLTITAYSLQDSIVILDRLRENLKFFRDKMSFADLANKSVTESWTRSFFTSISTLTAVTILTVFTGAVLRDFTTILLAGLFAGTFSSIYIVIPLLVKIEGKKDQVMRWDELGRQQLVEGVVSKRKSQKEKKSDNGVKQTPNEVNQEAQTASRKKKKKGSSSRRR